MAGKAPDVRVRLSAEGVQEVVNAFKRVQSEADRTAKAGGLAGRGLSFLTGQVGSLARALPLLTTGAVLAGFVALTKRALDTADALGKLEQKTGISVETLSTLSFAARTADVDQDQLRTGLIKFTKAVDDYDQGVKSARNATQQLFGDRDALKGLTDDQRLIKVVDALGKLEPGAKRTGLALDFFGKSGAELLPLIDDLGSGGFDELRKKAEKLGLVIDKDLADAAERANDAMTDLKSTAEGIALQFASSFAPALADVGDALVEATTEDGVSGFKLLGEFAGNVLKAILLLIATVAFGITEILGKSISLVVRSAQFGVNILKGDVSEGWEQFKADIINDANSLEKQLDEKASKFLDNLLGQNRTVSDRKRKERDRSRSKDLEQLDREAKARRELEESLLDNALKLQKAHLSLREQAEKESFERGNKSIEQFYAERKRLAEEAAQAEIAAIRERLSVLDSTPLQKGEAQADREKKIQDLRTQAAVRQIELEREIADLTADERKATEDNGRALLDFEARLAESQGNRTAAMQLALEEELRKYREILAQSNLAAEEQAARLAELQSAGTANINFEQIKAQGEAALNELGLKRQAIIDQVRSGILFQTQGEEQLAAIERERLPILQQIAAALLAAAQATGDPDKIAQAQQFNQVIKDLAISSDTAALKMADFKASLEQALTADLASFFTDGIKNAKSLGDAFRGLALAVVSSIAQIIAQMLAMLIVQKLLKAAGGFFGFSGGGEVGAASGGFVSGPGSSTSDSIPARLSNGEFVVRSAVVRQPGVREFLRELNQGGAQAVRRRRARGFAEGGLVEVETGNLQPGRADLFVGLDEGLLLKKLEASPMFARVVVKMAERNRKALNTALGRTAL